MPAWQAAQVMPVTVSSACAVAGVGVSAAGETGASTRGPPRTGRPRRIAGIGDGGQRRRLHGLVGRVHGGRADGHLGDPQTGDARERHADAADAVIAAHLVEREAVRHGPSIYPLPLSRQEAPAGRVRLRAPMLNPDRYFDPNPAVRDLARELYELRRRACRSSARTGTSIRGCSPKTRRFPIRPRCSSSPTTT